jgi:polysaccharide deacetylase family protein (PEP-CTERM system associated)
MTMLNSTPTIMLTIDVEDWFQVENFKTWIPFSSWSSCDLRVEKNTHRLLDLFDSIETAGRLESDEARRPGSKQAIMRLGQEAGKLETVKKSHPSSFQASQLRAKERPKATFFILGWIAERLPNLIREIKSRGHEVASHGDNHELCHRLSPDELKADLTQSKNLLEDIIGATVYGYRAPSFSINNDVLKVIQDCGYLYDSSYNSFGLNPRYGKINISKRQIDDSVIELSPNFYELPITNLKFKIKNLQLPIGGGGYFRLIPFPIFRYGVQRIIAKKDYLFYMHPWEIDPGQPRVRKASRQYRFRHYINLNKTHSKLARLIRSFQQYRFTTCKEYIDNKIPREN